MDQSIGSPQTQSTVGVCGHGGQCFRVTLHVNRSSNVDISQLKDLNSSELNSTYKLGYVISNVQQVSFSKSTLLKRR